jgi:hypothetical protein
MLKMQNKHYVNNEETILRKGEALLVKDGTVVLSTVGIDHIVPNINHETQTELDLCKSILKRLFHKESQLFDGTLYYSTGAGWCTCDPDQLKKDVKSVIGDYE